MEKSGAITCTDAGYPPEGPFPASTKGAMPEHLLMKKPNPELLKEYQDAAGEISATLPYHQRSRASRYDPVYQKTN